MVVVRTVLSIVLHDNSLDPESTHSKVRPHNKNISNPTRNNSNTPNLTLGQPRPPRSSHLLRLGGGVHPMGPSSSLLNVIAGIALSTGRHSWERAAETFPPIRA